MAALCSALSPKPYGGGTIVTEAGGELLLDDFVRRDLEIVLARYPP